jgi:hypothetical protein
VLAQNDFLKAASDLTLLLPAADVNGVTEVGLAEQIGLLWSGMVRL